jgi:general control protein GCN4
MAFDNLYLPGGDDMFSSQEEVMTGFDQFPTSNFTPINSSSSMQNPATVSPQELLNSFATPESSYLESPMMGSSAYATTPLEDGGFMDETLDFSSMNMPLFPNNGMDQFMEAPMQRVHSQSFTQSSSASPMVRQRSGPSPGSRPGTAHSRKHSLVAGVAKASASKSRKALPEIVIQEDDAKEIAKRKKNTAAARKSRENRANRMEALEAEVARLRGIVLDMGVDPDEGVDSPE